MNIKVWKINKLLRLAAAASFDSWDSARNNINKELKSMNIKVWKINKLLRLAADASFASTLRDSARKKKQGFKEL